MTDQEILYDIYQYLMESMEPDGLDVSFAFERASLQPPITPESLAELDMVRIINNPKLRHDVNFDRELHFRPNLDGSKGRAKMQSADQYWKALEGEFFMHGFVAESTSSAGFGVDYWQRVLQASQQRLRKIFEAIRDILKTLVPDYEQKTILDRLDVDLILQEITNGVCDLISLSGWLTRVLQAHCAPMRDEVVEGMKKEIQEGALSEDHEKLVNGLRQLLNVLEAMKLDVANHQIRHMRPLLVDDTINFQRRYNAHRISMGKINVRQAKTWLDDEIAHLLTGVHTPTDVEALGSALVKDLLFNETTMGPQTFYLDVDRLRILRAELHSRIFHGICRDILTDLAPVNVDQVELRKAHAALHVTLSAIVGPSGRFCDRMENIAVEIARILLMLEGRYPPFDSSSLGLVERKLECDLNDASPAFDKHATELCNILLPNLHSSVAQHVRMSAVDLQDALVPALPNNHPPVFVFGAVCAPPAPMKLYDPDEDIVKRLTHVICLHWHVWRDLVYLAPFPPEEDLSFPESAHSPPPSSGSASPTIPVAQAVYAPNGKWLPIAITVQEVPSGMPTPTPSPPPVAGPAPASVSERVESRSEHSEPSAEQSAHERQPQRST